MMDDNQGKRKWIRRAIIACVLVGIGLLAAFKWQDGLRLLLYHKPVQYDQPFGPVIAEADRIVVRGDGFDCCGPVNETAVLFTVTEPEEVADVATHIRFLPRLTTNSLSEACMCCGGPGIDWYKGKKRVALTAMQHGYAIRWRGFSTVRILGFRVGYGDGLLTEESQEWLKGWFRSHGIEPEEEEESGDKAVESDKE
ncbi:hypothetical protein VU12_07280 [Desulfobulbus sp. US4]|nr:hypothetical protein [Desulfobulbus sp. US4]